MKQSDKEAEGSVEGLDWDIGLCATALERMCTPTRSHIWVGPRVCVRVGLEPKSGSRQGSSQSQVGEKGLCRNSCDESRSQYNDGRTPAKKGLAFDLVQSLSLGLVLYLGWE